MNTKRKHNGLSADSAHSHAHNYAVTLADSNAIEQAI